MTDYRARSMWLDGVPGELTPRPSLPGPIDVDVAIVGAGLHRPVDRLLPQEGRPAPARRRPRARDRRLRGLGAQRRLVPHHLPRLARRRRQKTHGRQAVIDQQRALHATVLRDRARRGRGGHRRALPPRRAAGPRHHAGAAAARLREAVEYERSWGFGEDDYVHARRRRDARAHQGGRVPRRRLHAARRRRRPGPSGARPRRGRSSGWGCPSTSAPPSPARAAPRRRRRSATVRADVVVRATEAFTPELPGYERARRADLLADDRHRAAARRLLGRGRLERPRGVRRLPLPHLLRDAHRRRAHRHRRARRAVPLRLAARASASSATRRCRTTCAPCSASSSRASATRA